MNITLEIKILCKLLYNLHTFYTHQMWAYNLYVYIFTNNVHIHNRFVFIPESIVKLSKGPHVYV